jgi:imidazoleglycerol-phosphate dehydratase
VGIAIGAALDHAMNFRRDGVKGIRRYGNMILPMDETLILSAIDLSGRGFLVKDLNIQATKVGDFDTELLEEFLQAFVRTSGATLHVRQLSGSNAHHIIEGAFKSIARSLKQAVAIDPSAKDEIPSTKGVL